MPTALHSYTSKIFKELDIGYIRFHDEQNDKYVHEIGSTSPVFSGLTKLSHAWDFNDVIKAVSLWRENMWEIEEKKLQLPRQL